MGKQEIGATGPQELRVITRVAEKVEKLFGFRELTLDQQLALKIYTYQLTGFFKGQFFTAIRGHQDVETILDHFEALNGREVPLRLVKGAELIVLSEILIDLKEK